uniref:Tetraspanin n=1 Tax=Ascaris suum TaxID=6253 RepID=F1LBH7_ASCSU
MLSGGAEIDDTEIPQCAKYLVFAVSGFFLFISTLLLAVGIWANIEKGGIMAELNKAKIADDIAIVDPTLIVIIIGAAMFFIDFFGWFGAMRENVLCLLIYHTSMGIIIIAELALIVLFGIGQHFISLIIESKLNDTIINYRDDLDMRDFIDWSQTALRCCGLRSADDWNENLYFSDEPSLKIYLSPEAGGVPYSCCINKTVSGIINKACGYKTRLHKRKGKSGYNVYPNVYQRGCIEGLRTAVTKYIFIIGPIVIGIILVEILCFLLSRRLMKVILEQRQRWYNTNEIS